MDWKDIAATVGKAAPILGTLLTGPAAAAVTVGGMIASALGTEAEPDQVAAALRGDPEAMVKLREIEARRQTELEGLATDLAKVRILADVQDRTSAREREAKTGDSVTPRLLAMAVTLGFFGVLAYLLHFGKPEAGGDALLVMLGSLGGAWTAIVAYYFGSSAGSREKTELLAKR